MTQRRYKDFVHFQAVRAEALQRDAYRCVICGSTEAITTHHIRPIKLYATIREADTVGNLTTLCELHHNALHRWAHTTGQRLASYIVAQLVWRIGVLLIWLARRSLTRPLAQAVFNRKELAR